MVCISLSWWVMTSTSDLHVLVHSSRKPASFCSSSRRKSVRSTSPDSRREAQAPHVPVLHRLGTSTPAARAPCRAVTTKTATAPQQGSAMRTAYSWGRCGYVTDGVGQSVNNWVQDALVVARTVVFGVQEHAASCADSTLQDPSRIQVRRSTAATASLVQPVQWTGLLQANLLHYCNGAAPMCKL